MVRLSAHQTMRLHATSLPLEDSKAHLSSGSVVDGVDGAKLLTQPHCDHGRLHLDDYVSRRGLEYYIAQLQSEDVSEMTDLQKDVRRELVAAGQSKFTISKTERQFIELMKIGAIVLGIFDANTNALIGQSMLSPHHGSVPRIPTFLAHEGAAFIREGTMVRSAYRGHSFNKRMLQVQKAMVGPKDIIVVEIDANNIFNLRGLMASGFVLYDAYVDPKNDGQALALTTVPASRAPVLSAQLHYASSFDEIRALLSEGCLGTHLRDREIGFQRNS